MDGTNIDFIVLSRLSWKRVGMRYITRGVDQQGHVANFVETEQIVRSTYHLYTNFLKKEGDDLKSFLQIRGSIPLFWTQKPNLQYKPRARLNEKKNNNSNAFRTHFDTLRARYNKITIINLVNQKGEEKELADEYKKYSSTYNHGDVQYDLFANFIIFQLC